MNHRQCTGRAAIDAQAATDAEVLVEEQHRLLLASEPDVVGAGDRDAVRRAHVDAETAEDAQLGREHHVVETAQTAQSFEAGLTLVVSDLDLAEADAPLGWRRRDLLARDRVVVAVESSEAGAELDANLVTRGRRRAGERAVNRGSRAPAVGDRVDQVAGPPGDVTSGPDTRIRGAQRAGIDLHATRTIALQRDRAEEAHVGALSDREDDRVGRDHGFGAGLERGCEASLGVEDRRHRDGLEPADLVLSDEPVRALPVDDSDALALGLFDLLGIGRDLFG